MLLIFLKINLNSFLTIFKDFGISLKKIFFKSKFTKTIEYILIFKKDLLDVIISI